MKNNEDIVANLKAEIGSHDPFVNDTLCVIITCHLFREYPELLDIYIDKIDIIHKKNEDDEGFFNVHFQVLHKLNKDEIGRYLKIIEPRLKTRIKSFGNNDFESLAAFHTKAGQYNKSDFWIKKISKDSSLYRQASDYLALEKGGEKFLNELISNKEEEFNLGLYYELVKEFIQKDESWFAKIVEHISLSLTNHSDNENSDKNTLLLFRLIGENPEIKLLESTRDRLLNLRMTLTQKFHFIATLIQIGQLESAQTLYNKSIKEYSDKIMTDNSYSYTVMTISPFLGKELKISGKDASLYLGILDKFSGFQKKELIECFLRIEELSNPVEKYLLSEFSKEISTGIVLARTGRIDKAYQIAISIDDSKFQIVTNICDYFSEDLPNFSKFLSEIDSQRIQAETILNAVKKNVLSNQNTAIALLELGKNAISDLIPYHKERYSREFCFLSGTLKINDLFRHFYEDLSNSTNKLYCLTQKLIKTANNI